jgi:hypothetical protein
MSKSFYWAEHEHMAKGGHGLPKVSLRPTMPDPSTPCRRAMPETALPRVGGLQPSFTPLDTPPLTPLLPTPSQDRLPIDGYPSRCFGFNMRKSRYILWSIKKKLVNNVWLLQLYPPQTLAIGHWPGFRILIVAPGSQSRTFITHTSLQNINKDKQMRISWGSRGSMTCYVSKVT